MLVIHVCTQNTTLYKDRRPKKKDIHVDDIRTRTCTMYMNTCTHHYIKFFTQQLQWLKNYNNYLYTAASKANTYTYMCIILYNYSMQLASIVYPSQIFSKVYQKHF